MRQIKCPDCNEKCIKHGVLKSGSQRWFCKHCKVAFTVKINNLSKELNLKSLCLMVLMVYLKHYEKFGLIVATKDAYFIFFVRLDDIRQVDLKR